MMFVNSESLTKLVCIKCKSPLSHFPIYSNIRGGSVCGRCSLTLDENVIRNDIYETLAEKQKFPCRYNNNGCLEKLIPQDVPKHENFCAHKKYSCPIIINPKCEWTGYVRDLLEHFEQVHPTFLLSEGRFKIDFINNHQENYLLPHGVDLFVVFRSTNSKLNTFYCSVSYIGSNTSISNCSFRMLFQGSNKSGQYEIEQKINGTIEVKSDNLRKILNDPSSIIAKIDIMNANISPEQNQADDEIDDSINYEMLQEIECVVCMEYMVPPIYQCLTGHSICFKCKEEVSECPTCKIAFQNTQNFALAQIIQHLKYPCKYSRCKFTAKPKFIKQHEATCIHGESACPLREYVGCNDKLMYSEMYEHICRNHYENLVEYEIITMPFDSNKTVNDCFIIQYGGKLFKLHYAFCETDQQLKWSMQLIGPSIDAEKYKFEIDIIDTKGGNLRFYFKMPCQPLNDKFLDEVDNENAYFIDIDQLKLMIGSELSYRVRILEQ